MSLRAHDARRVLDAVAEVAATTSIAELEQTAARVGFDLLTVERSGWVAIDRCGRDMRGVHWPQPIPHLLERLPMDIARIPLVTQQLTSEHPITLRISDIWSRRQWHAQPIWAELYHPEGAEYQIGSRVSVGPRAMHAMSFFRSDRDFSTREVAIAEEFTRHVRIAAARLQDRRDVGLTPRQSEALRALETGDTVRQAAARLGVTEKTLENHLQAAYRRLGVNNRVAALRRLRGEG